MGMLLPAVAALMLPVPIMGEAFRSDDSNQCNSGRLNSLGPVFVAIDLFGIGYERSVSEWFSLGIMACSSGETDFAGVKMLLSNRSAGLQLRPSLGFCADRRDDRHASGQTDIRWFVWPGLGLFGRFGRISVSADFSAGSQGPGIPDDGIIIISTALMYMF